MILRPVNRQLLRKQLRWRDDCSLSALSSTRQHGNTATNINVVHFGKLVLGDVLFLLSCNLIFKVQLDVDIIEQTWLLGKLSMIFTDISSLLDKQTPWRDWEAKWCSTAPPFKLSQVDADHICGRLNLKIT